VVLTLSAIASGSTSPALVLRRQRRHDPDSNAGSPEEDGQKEDKLFTGHSAPASTALVISIRQRQSCPGYSVVAPALPWFQGGSNGTNPTQAQAARKTAVGRKTNSSQATQCQPALPW
jgi:hypothetical protein